jgi:hypothetical protein
MFLSQALLIVDGKRVFVPQLLQDPTLAYNSLDSFLGGDRAENLSSVLGELETNELRRESLHGVAIEAVAKLTTSFDDLNAWRNLLAIIGDLPPYPDLVEPIKTVLKKTDFVSLWQKNLLGKYVFQAATAWLSPLSDDSLRAYLKEQLFAICKLVDRTGAEVIENAEHSEIIILEAALNLSMFGQEVPRAISDFHDVLVQLVRTAPALVPKFRPVIQKLCEDLPISHVRQIYPLLLQMQAS